MAGVAGAVLLLLTGCGGGTGEGNGCHTSAQLEQADSLLLLGQNSPSFQTLHANIALCAPPDVAVRSMAESWQDFRSSMNLLQTRDVDIVEAIGIDLSELAQAGELLALNRLDIKAVDRTLDAYHPTLVNAVTAGKNVYALPFGFDAQIQLYRASVTKPAKDLDDLIEMGQEGVSVAFPSADGVAIFDSFTALFYGHGGDWRDIKEKPLQRAYADFKQLYLLMSADQRDKTAQEIRDGLDNGTVDIALLWGSWARTLIAAGGTPGAISPAPAPKGSKEVASSLLIQGLALPAKTDDPVFRASMMLDAVNPSLLSNRAYPFYSGHKELLRQASDERLQPTTAVLRDTLDERPQPTYVWHISDQSNYIAVGKVLRDSIEDETVDGEAFARRIIDLGI